MGKRRQREKSLGGEAVSAVARDELRARLHRAQRHFKASAKYSSKASKHVHQLRVATRRAQAALDVFSDLLPRRRAKRISKQLAHVRRLAGRARDLDVLVLRLQRLVGIESSPVVMLVDHLQMQRRVVQKPMRDAWSKSRRNHFAVDARKLIRATKWRGAECEPTFCEFAARGLTGLVDAFVAAGQLDFACIENLHTYRKAGKQLRYAFELLGPAFKTKRLVPSLSDFRKLQNQLGDINDHAVAQRLFSDLSAATDDEGMKEWLSILADEANASLELAMGRFLAEYDPARNDVLRSRLADLARERLNAT